MLDLTFPKKVIANTVKLVVFTLKEGSDCASCTTFSPEDRSGRR